MLFADHDRNRLHQTGAAGYSRRGFIVIGPRRSAGLPHWTCRIWGQRANSAGPPASWPPHASKSVPAAVARRRPAAAPAQHLPARAFEKMAFIRTPLLSVPT